MGGVVGGVVGGVLGVVVRGKVGSVVDQRGKSSATILILCVVRWNQSPTIAASVSDVIGTVLRFVD